MDSNAPLVERVVDEAEVCRYFDCVATRLPAMNMKNILLSHPDIIYLERITCDGVVFYRLCVFRKKLHEMIPDIRKEGIIVQDVANFERSWKHLGFGVIKTTHGNKTDIKEWMFAEHLKQLPDEVIVKVCDVNCPFVKDRLNNKEMKKSRKSKRLQKRPMDKEEYLYRGRNIGKEDVELAKQKSTPFKKRMCVREITKETDDNSEVEIINIVLDEFVSSHLGDFNFEGLNDVLC